MSCGICIAGTPTEQVTWERYVLINAFDWVWKRWSWSCITDPFSENSAFRTSFIAIPKIIFFPFSHPYLNFAESLFPGSSQIPYPVSVFPNPAVYFGQILADRWNTLLRNKSNTNGVPDLIQIHVTWRDCTYREFKQGRFWATHVNRKWTFCTLRAWFGANSSANRLYKLKTFSNTNLVTWRHIEREK